MVNGVLQSVIAGVSFRLRFAARCTLGAMIVLVGPQRFSFNSRSIDRLATET
jgi:hypothetical protein